MAKPGPSSTVECLTSKLTRPLNSIINLCLTRLIRGSGEPLGGVIPENVTSFDIRVPVRAGQTSAGDHIRTLFDCELPSDKENESFVKCLEKAQLSGSGIRFVVLVDPWDRDKGTSMSRPFFWER
eukprot:sb/3475663/